MPPFSDYTTKVMGVKVVLTRLQICYNVSVMENFMENTDLRALLKDYSSKWVALSSDSKRVVGVADNIGDAIKQANEKRENNPVLTKTPEKYGTFVL